MNSLNKRLAKRIGFTCVLAALTSCAPDVEQVADSVAVGGTLSDYQRAEQFLSQNTNPLVAGRILSQYWQSDNRLVYRRSTSSGSEIVLADPTTGQTAELFDADLLSTALATYSDSEIDAEDLVLSAIELTADSQAFEFNFSSRRYRYDPSENALLQFAGDPDDEYLSPDGSKAIFIQDHNLWLRNTSNNELTQLTFDGVENYGYGTNNAGWLRDDGPVLLWSPDSSKIASFRHDGREVGEMYLYNTQVGHSELDAWKYPLPGDDHIFMIERMVIHLQPTPRLVMLDMPPDDHRSSTADHVAGRGGRFLDVEWSADSQTLAFLSSSRDHKSATLRLADPDTGAVRDVFNETVATYFESGSSDANWRVLHDRDEFIWFSEQDNWGHLYLHDLQSGELKQQLTSGNWVVLDVEKIDLEAEQIYFIAGGREATDPYFRHLYRVNLDGSSLTLLTPEPANHGISWAESGEYFTDVYSTPSTAPIAVVRNKHGDRVMELATADISALEATGWVPPEQFAVKARDQQTDLYGLLYKPSNFDESASYPVLNYLYPGPQSGSVGSRSFLSARRDKQALAELGFVVVEVDAMGTPGRSKSFHDAYYGNMGDNGLPDQIATIRQLASTRPWMDIDRVGIWGHSGGGFASTAGLLRYPEFYKVAVSGAGNHDNRNYEDDWGEKWQGLLEVYPESNIGTASTISTGSRTSYDNQANQLLAENLQGKLLLAHGLLDDNVPPTNTFLVVQALIEAEKDFDLLVFPEARHGFGNSRYFMKRRWDYFVEHLIGIDPPANFRFSENIP